MNIYILAGGKAPEGLGITYKGEFVFRGRTLAENVRQALAPLGDPKLVGGPAPDLPGSEKLVDVLRSLVQHQPTGPMLLAAADLPFLTTDSAQQFLSEVKPATELAYPAVRTDAFDTLYPGFHRTPLRLKEGEFTGGNLFWVQAEALGRILPMMEQVIAARKNVLEIGRAVGPGLLFALGMARLWPQAVRVAHLERVIERRLKVRVQAVLTSHPSVAADVDKTSQFAWLTDLENQGS